VGRGEGGIAGRLEKEETFGDLYSEITIGTMRRGNSLRIFQPQGSSLGKDCLKRGSTSKRLKGGRGTVKYTRTWRGIIREGTVQ